METFESQAEKDNRRTSAIITALMTLLLLFMLFYPFFSFAEDENISGIMVALGVPDMESMGEEVGAAPTESTEDSDTSTNDSSEGSESSDDAEPIASSETSASTQKDVKTAEQDDSVNLNKDKDEKDKSDKKDKDDKKKNDKTAQEKAEEAKKKAEEEAKKRAEEEKRRKEKELADKKKELSDLLGGGDGNDSSTNGQEDGAPDKSNLEGITTGIGDIGGGLSGRDVVYRPKITDNSQETGTVVVKVCVDNKGKVTKSEVTQTGTTTTSQTLRSKAVAGAKKFKFSPGDEDKLCGTITFTFKFG